MLLQPACLFFLLSWAQRGILLNQGLLILFLTSMQSLTFVADDWEICLYFRGTDSSSALNMMMVVFIYRYPVNDLYPSSYTSTIGTIGAFCIS